MVGKTVDHSDPAAIVVVATCNCPRPAPNYIVGEEKILCAAAEKTITEAEVSIKPQPP
jgi:hypothetical protein